MKMQETRRRSAANRVPSSGSLSKLSIPMSSPVSRKRRLQPDTFFSWVERVAWRRPLYWTGASTALILLLFQKHGVLLDSLNDNVNNDHTSASSSKIPSPSSPLVLENAFSHNEQNKILKEGKNVITAHTPKSLPIAEEQPILVDSLVVPDKDVGHQRQRGLPRNHIGATIPAHPVPSPSPSPQESSRIHNETSLIRTESLTLAMPHVIIPHEENSFLDWCRLVLGIETNLEIQTFEYYDYMKALPGQAWDSDDAAYEDDHPAYSSLPMIPVRGLAASRNISSGEVVIRIPLQALFSVTTTIDKDPVLGQVIGVEARRRYGWDLDRPGGLSDDVDQVEPSMILLEIEIPLLAVALLHHRRLGSASSLAPYVRILTGTPVDNLPFLWNKNQLSTVSDGIRAVSQGVKREMRAMYDQVVAGVLIPEYPHLFNNDAFNLTNFAWAFAIVNSRYWMLSVSDMHTPVASPAQLQDEKHQMEAIVDELPPADTPTDAWVAAGGHHKQVPSHASQPVTFKASKSPKHSFLAPFADLLNFGPPCTVGIYNQSTHTFEIVASCNLTKGQEVTFWYSDKCDHILVALYGFMHPMIPPCPSSEDHKRNADEWRSRAKDLESQLYTSIEDVHRAERENVELHTLLEECDCPKYKEETMKRYSVGDGVAPNLIHEEVPSRLRHEHIRIADQNEIERRRVRKMTRQSDSEF